MTIEMVAVAAIIVLPAGVFLGWLAVMGAVVAALGAPTETESR